jgi:hypothetical protein
MRIDLVPWIRIRMKQTQNRTLLVVLQLCVVFDTINAR